MNSELLPLVSVVTVVYNGGSTIEKTMKSVLSQDYPNFEYILIDGNSIDNTPQIITQFAEYNARVLFHREKDDGVYDAMNKAVKMAKGEWICFMNCGDFFFNNNVISDISRHFSSVADIIYGNTNMITENGFIIDYAKEPSFLLQNMPFCHQSSFVRTKLLKERPFNTKYKYVADYDFFYNCYVNSHCFVKSNIIISTYNTIEGLSAENKMKVLNEILQVRKPTDTLFNKLKIYNIYYRYRILEILKSYFPNLVFLLRYKKI